MTNSSRPLVGAVLILMLATLSACGGGGGGSSSSAETGQVAVLITDGPTDEYERMLVTMRRMLLLGAGNGHRVLYDGPPVTFDLLELRDRADLAFTADILADTYTKIRIELEEVRLVDVGDPSDPGDDNEVVLDKLPANGKIDLNPRGPFTVEAGRTTVIHLDMDANRSVQVIEKGTGALGLRPIIFVDVYTDDIVLPSRLVRVFGVVDSADEGNDSLLLCELEFIAQLGGPSMADDDDCVRVFAESASIFDADGLPTSFESIVDALDGDDPVALTAIGLPSVPNGGAPASVVLDLDGVVAALGPRRTDTESGWETTSGIISSDLVACDADQCVDFLPNMEADPILTRLQSETRVFSADGTELSAGDIDNTDPATVDGLRVDDGGTDELRAALVVLGPDLGDVLVSGTLTDVSSTDDFDILTIVPEGEDPVSVCVAQDAEVVRVIVDDTVVTIADLLDPLVLDPSAGLQVDAAGDESAAADCDVEAIVVVVE